MHQHLSGDQNETTKGAIMSRFFLTTLKCRFNPKYINLCNWKFYGELPQQEYPDPTWNVPHYVCKKCGKIKVVSPLANWWDKFWSKRKGQLDDSGIRDIQGKIRWYSFKSANALIKRGFWAWSTDRVVFQTKH